MHEGQMHGTENSFITLTYDDEHLTNPSLNYRDFQLFMKRFRQEVNKPIRFFMCGEYGDVNRRPHFHACIFGWRFHDRKPWSTGDSGATNYRSAQLEKLWPLGYSMVGDLNYQTAQYCASYIIKKITGDLAEQHYRYLNPETGEIHQLTPEFCQMSRKPGIGYEWFQKYGQRQKDFDTVVINGRESSPPKYYDKLRRRQDKTEIQEAKDQREYKYRLKKLDNTDARLLVKEECALSRRKFHKTRKGTL